MLQWLHVTFEKSNSLSYLVTLIVANGVTIVIVTPSLAIYS